MRVVAHRGNSAVAPESTLAAIASAVACGADGVEIDVQLSRDRVPVVIHDETLDRTTDGSGPVSAALAEEVATLDAGAWFGDRFSGERVPLLTDVLDLLAAAGGIELLAAAGGIELLLELKGAWDADDVREVTGAVAYRGLGERVVAQSFSVRTVAALAAVAPGLRRALLVTEVGDGVLELCRELGASGCNPHGKALRTPEVVGRLRAAGLTVTPWTLNEPEDWAAARGLGVDGIITDRPADLLAWTAGPAA